jgi:protein-disulfide isomerase
MFFSNAEQSKNNQAGMTQVKALTNTPFIFINGL